MFCEPFEKNLRRGPIYSTLKKLAAALAKLSVFVWEREKEGEGEDWRIRKKRMIKEQPYPFQSFVLVGLIPSSTHC